MTYLCVPIFVEDADRARHLVAIAAEAGADIVEFRIDRLTDSAVAHDVVNSSSLPVITTCRPTWEGGESELPELERLSLLRAAATNGAYIDVELAVGERIGEFTVNPRDVRPGVIVSSHDFKGRPERLYNVLSEMNARSGDVNKIVWLARSIRDNIEAFEILQQRQKPTIALCMGEQGLISRVLAKKFGAFLTFASLRDESATAPGQVTIAQMKNLYRWDALNEKTKVYGVVGSPVAHSMSPAIHNAGFEAANHDGIYLPLLVNPGYESFKAFMESFLAFAPLDLAGLSITIPHKENALRYLKEKNAEIEPLADSIGTVNTITINRADSSHSSPSSGTPAAAEIAGRKGWGEGLCLSGFNTDYSAILDTITSALNITRAQLSEKRVAVIGAGGTGRTAVAALAACGATVVVYNRTKERADALATEFNGKTGQVVAARMEKLCDSCCHVYINTTSLGMHPKTDESPLGGTPPKFTPETLVFDTIYNPLETKLLRDAKQSGAKTVGGIEMFIRQAAGQFQSWTGKSAPLNLFRKVVESHLSQKV